MLFEISNDVLEKCTTTWMHKELDIEKLILSKITDDNPLLDEDIFGEELFFVGRQVPNSDKKRPDIIAMDKEGNLVVIELKKDQGRLGVEMQALQYLSNLSQYKGEDFLENFNKRKNADDFNQFLNDGRFIKDINQSGRIILVARFFDPSLFSMGKWLAGQGVAFKCISYETIKILDKKLLNFSVIFDQTSSLSQYKLKFSNTTRSPAVFWHNIGAVKNKDEEWWKFLIASKQIPASFDNVPGDRGEEILKNYIKGDKIFAYVSGIGCVGYGEIEDPKYTLIEADSDDNYFKPAIRYLHRLSIKWKHVVMFDKAIKASDFEKNYNIAHPIQTSSRIKSGNYEALATKLKGIP